MDQKKIAEILNEIYQFINAKINIEGITKKDLVSKKKELYELIAKIIIELKLTERDKIMLYNKLSDQYNDVNWEPEFLSKTEEIITRLRTVDQNIKEQFAEKFLNDTSMADSLEYKPNPLGKTAAESGGIIIHQGKKYYVKPCMYDDSGKKINVKEIFIYKFLEYTGFGPKIYFLATELSSSVSGHYKGYIVSEDIAGFDHLKFYLDQVSELDQNIDSIQDLWHKAMSNQHFLIEFLVLSLIDDIAIINDSLGSNPANYGVLVDQAKQTFHARIIDFLPDSLRRIEFSEGGSLFQKLKTKLETSRNIPGRGTDHVLSLNSLQDDIVNAALEEGVNIFLSRLDILKALETAFLYTEKFISHSVYADSFSSNATKVLTEYKERILKKYEEAKSSGIMIASTTPLDLSGVLCKLCPDYIDYLESARALSLQEEASAQESTAPKAIEGYELQDVEGDGNCFYHAIYEQIKKLNLVNHFLQNCPPSTEPHDWLRLQIEGSNFSDGNWASGEDILVMSHRLNVRIAVIDTRHPDQGYHIYDDTKNLLPDAPILRLAFTGNHFLSVVSGPPVILTQDQVALAATMRENDDVAGVGAVAGLPMKLQDLQLNAELLGISVINTLPEAKNGFRYILIDSDKLAVTARKDVYEVCLNIQDNTASCGDNALLIAKKAKELNFESYIYVTKGHAVALIRYNETLDSQTILKMITDIELQEEAGLWEKYVEVMTGKILYLGNSQEAILQEFGRIIKDLNTIEEKVLQEKIDNLLVKIDSTNIADLNTLLPVLHGLLEQINELKGLKTALDTNNLETLYNNLIVYITEFADTATETTKTLLQSLLLSIETEFQSSVNYFPPFYPSGRPDDEPDYGGGSYFDRQDPNDNYAMMISGNNISANYSMAE